MTTTFCISGAVIKKAGLNINNNLSAGTLYLSGSNFIIDTWINDAESIINIQTRRNWIDIYDDLNPDVKDILRDAASSLAAINCINFDMGGYTSRAEATTMLNVLRDQFIRDIEILKDKDNQAFIVGA